jgi:poly(3-hydroxyalkanoate) synthetase
MATWTEGVVAAFVPNNSSVTWQGAARRAGSAHLHRDEPLIGRAGAARAEVGIGKVRPDLARSRGRRALS